MGLRKFWWVLGGLVPSMGVNRGSITVAGTCARAAGDTNPEGTRLGLEQRPRIRFGNGAEWVPLKPPRSSFKEAMLPAQVPGESPSCMLERYHLGFIRF